MRGEPFDPSRLKVLRERLGLSQQEMATRLGVSVQSIHRWESGKKGPIKPYLDKIEALEWRAEREGKGKAAA